ncbi:glycerate kinase [Halospina denitrificans]|uniref:Glycerate kinase n=1 Tax=Halospina denitrificans TaxID=332522 RepID=A0A4R7JWV6_9GAMM|nr:hypothetical protein [Halospina denitrificans]TDT42942.1 glycerate kinase [Halospina denitrificans]
MPTRKADHASAPRELILPEACWPLGEPLSGDAIHGAQQHAVLAVQRFIADEQLPQAYSSLFPKLIIPMGAWLLREQQKLGRPLVMGIGGSQGSGKTTLARGLRLALHHCFAVSSCVLSLDDFYRPHEERARLAEEVHPLLATRGAPGTHDVDLLMNTLDALSAADSRRVTSIPTFDKGRDTRAAEDHFQQFQGRPGIILLEGWCLGARPESEVTLAEPINALEASEDPEAHWRRYVNQQLAGPYQALFNRFDRLLFLKAPGWDAVRRWRLRQEAKLIRERGDDYRGHLDEGESFERFMAHYERITRQLLREPPAADAILALDEQQRLARLSLTAHRHD